MAKTEVDLKELEEKSIFIIREAKARFKNPAVMWSTGKDSTCMLALIRRTFYGGVPFPVVHLDTSFKFPQIYEFRNRLAKEWNLNLMVGKNEEALKKGMSPKTASKFDCCMALKTEALKQVLREHKFDALIMSIRRDEHVMRNIERYFCLPGDSRVYMLDGVRTIEEIKNGDRLFSYNGGLDTVVDKYSRFYDGELIKINLKSSLPIKLTPNHVLLAKVTRKKGNEKKLKLRVKGFDGKVYENIVHLTGTPKNKWISASELRVGDKVFIPNCKKISQDKIKSPYRVVVKDVIGRDHINLTEKKKRLKWKSSHTITDDFPRIIYLKPDVMRLLGYYIAEGCCGARGTQVQLPFHEKETNLIEDVLKIVNDNFGVNGVIHKCKGKCKNVIMSSKTLALLLSNLCGSGAANKRLPDFFMKLTKAQLVMLIKGCWLGDGYDNRYNTISETLAHQIRLALLRLKILSTVKKYKEGDNKERYMVIVSRVSYERFKKMFGVKLKHKFANRFVYPKEVGESWCKHPKSGKRNHSKRGGFWVRVNKTSKVTYKGMVYDLKVEKNSSYVVDGIVVHNSPRDKEFKWHIVRPKTKEEMKEGDAPFVSEQQPELWNLYQTDFGKDCSHVRVHPILHWTELDVWRFLKQEGIPINPLYFSVGGERYRSLGCMPCTSPIESNARTIDEIIDELRATDTEERAGRAQDKEEEQIFRRMRALGYM